MNHSSASLCLQSQPHLGCAHVHLGVTLVSRWSPNLRPSQIIITLTVLLTHNITSNCIYFQSHLLCLYKLNCNRFNHLKRPIFFSALATSNNQPDFIRRMKVGRVIIVWHGLSICPCVGPSIRLSICLLTYGSLPE